MSEPRPVVIDTDPGIDDALALALALQSPELDVRLVTTVAGNADIEQVTRNAALMLGLLATGRDLVLARGSARPLSRQPVDAAGFHGEDGLGGSRELLLASGCHPWPVRGEAVGRLLRAAREHAGALTIIALGPLTNIARAVRRDPRAMAGVGRIIAMGGAVRVAGNVTPAAEFNAHADPHALATVLAADLQLTLVPLDVTQQVRLTEAALRRGLGGRRDGPGRALRQMMRLPLRRHRRSGIALHDPLAVALALDAGLARTERVALSAVCEGELTAGMTLEDRRSPVQQALIGHAVDVALAVDVPAVLSLFTSRVLAPRSARQPAQVPAVTVVGSVNVDFAVQATDLPRAGQTVLGGELYRASGGKGANQAVAASRAGAQVRFVGCVGDDEPGRSSRDALAASGIDVRGLRQVAGATGAALVCIDQHGQNQIAVAPGANASVGTAAVRASRRSICSARVLVTQLETPLEGVLEALRLARASGVTTVLNPAPMTTLPADLPASVDVLVANELEAEALLGQPVNTVPEVRRALQSLETLGYRNVVITLGRRGVMWRAEGRFGRLRAAPVAVVDSTGAGDTFVGYLAAALAEGAALADAIELANQAAALAVTRLGAQGAVPTRAEVQEQLARDA